MEDIKRDWYSGVVSVPTESVPNELPCSLCMNRSRKRKGQVLSSARVQMCLAGKESQQHNIIIIQQCSGHIPCPQHREMPGTKSPHQSRAVRTTTNPGATSQGGGSVQAKLSCQLGSGWGSLKSSDNFEAPHSSAPWDLDTQLVPYKSFINISSPPTKDPNGKDYHFSPT